MTVQLVLRRCRVEGERPSHGIADHVGDEEYQRHQRQDENYGPEEPGGYEARHLGSSGMTLGGRYQGPVG